MSQEAAQANSISTARFSDKGPSSDRRKFDERKLWGKARRFDQLIETATKEGYLYAGFFGIRRDKAKWFSKRQLRRALEIQALQRVLQIGHGEHVLFPDHRVGIDTDHLISVSVIDDPYYEKPGDKNKSVKEYMKLCEKYYRDHRSDMDRIQKNYHIEYPLVMSITKDDAVVDRYRHSTDSFEYDYYLVKIKSRPRAADEVAPQPSL